MKSLNPQNTAKSLIRYYYGSGIFFSKNISAAGGRNISSLESSLLVLTGVRKKEQEKNLNKTVASSVFVVQE